MNLELALLDRLRQVAGAEVHLVDHEAHLFHLQREMLLDRVLERGALIRNEVGERHLPGDVLRHRDDRASNERALDVLDVGHVAAVDVGGAAGGGDLQGPAGDRLAHLGEDVRIGLADLHRPRPAQDDHRLLIIVT